MHRRTKALQIPPKVKAAVYERDNHCSVWSHRYVPLSCACCHFVRRTQGGLGIPENIITLTPDEHAMFDSGPKETREEMKAYFREYLMRHYPGWSEDKLVYKKE